MIKKPVERQISTGLEAAFGEHLAIGAVFVMVSLARSYLLRRLFERLRGARPCA